MLNRTSDSSALALSGADETALAPTPTLDDLPRRLADFNTLGEALDYAAHGKRGLNFFDARARLARVLTFADLKADATANAYRLIAAGIKPGDRVALIAETSADFVSLFFGAIYAGALPVPLPLPTSFGGREGYVEQIRSQLTSCDPEIALAPSGLAAIAAEAAHGLRCRTAHDWLDFMAREAKPAALPSARKSDIAYLQYSSGSTRFPHGVEITHEALLANLNGHAVGVKLQRDDRVISWLPYYHDMGLVGCLMAPIANQVSADYLATEDFARRPLSWLALITRNEGHSLSYSPTFGYDICARRVSSQTDVAERFDLSRWRVAGNGADMIRPDVMSAFVEAFAPAGFSGGAFLPSYGLAEATLAVTISPPGTGIVTDLVDERLLSGEREDNGTGTDTGRMRAIVNCGVALPGMEIEIRDESGRRLGDRQIGKVFVAGPSIMTGYFRDEISTRAALQGEWLDTGDMGYMLESALYIVGRAKDMIIINGKNHWPQDIEWAIEQLPGFKAGDIAAFSITTEGGEESPAVLVQCRTSDAAERADLRETIRAKVRAITGMNCIVELVPPRTLPRTSSGKLSRSKARSLYLSGQIQPFDIAA
ncbi:fatty acyl-AMP ligase [Sphingosinicella microcystinivorans]|uniref:Acyl-CoA synthetase n=1 Tax=Sphingosinicella microcystinivorans TaxID=335406 RepID=A0AAD1G2K3_SPHMI|nr:fatty acyl-AMP ligase [Sphingosinicella microcystinivorans]RKS88023.1 fatty-acyl-CoA synthase [Sphingosinicella microcystinivorans]BBE35834.1 acyl-CoA synthetase [Sphingosinicella microcystinivorans]